jgi:hypothetical protein
MKGDSHVLFSKHTNHTVEFIEQILMGSWKWVLSYRPEVWGDPRRFLLLCYDQHENTPKIFKNATSTKFLCRGRHSGCSKFSADFYQENVR